MENTDLCLFLEEYKKEFPIENCETVIIEEKVDKKHEALAKIEEILKQYGWEFDFENIYNRKGILVHKVEIKRGRVLLYDDGILRASLAKPENIGQYIEKTFYATK